MNRPPTAAERKRAYRLRLRLTVPPADKYAPSPAPVAWYVRCRDSGRWLGSYVPGTRSYCTLAKIRASRWLGSPSRTRCGRWSRWGATHC